MASCLFRGDGGFVAGAFGDGNWDGDGGAVGAFDLSCGVDGEEGGVGAHQVVFEGEGADGGREVGGGVPGGAVGEVGDLLAGPDGAEGGVFRGDGVEVKRERDFFGFVAELAF